MTALGLVGREKGGGSEKGEVNRKEYVCVLQMPPVTKDSHCAFPVPELLQSQHLPPSNKCQPHSLSHC